MEDNDPWTLHTKRYALEAAIKDLKIYAHWKQTPNLLSILESILEDLKKDQEGVSDVIEEAYELGLTKSTEDF